MKLLTMLLATTLLLTATTATAQRRNRMTAAERAKAEREAQEAQRRLDLMTAATQRIVFIDSIVVDKTDFLSHYNIGPEAGSLHTYNEFFGGKDTADAFVYLNELGDKCYFSSPDTTLNDALYSADKLNEQWLKPARLRGFGDSKAITELNYPFMMADGATLYFAAKGDESIGGYDIFVTRYDHDNGRFLQPENIGMPFNSTANDYMYAIDEFNNIGWFATDRRQPADKVCIYMFIPTETRQLYSPDDYSPELINSFAQLQSIAATWPDDDTRAKALERLQSIGPDKTVDAADPAFVFVINDNTVYTRLSQFRDKQNVVRYKRLHTLQQSILSTESALSQSRRQLEQSRRAPSQTLRSQILNSEAQLLSLQDQADELAKEIRNAENAAISR